MKPVRNNDATVPGPRNRGGNNVLFTCPLSLTPGGNVPALCYRICSTRFQWEGAKRRNLLQHRITCQTHRSFIFHGIPLLSANTVRAITSVTLSTVPWLEP